MELNHATHPTSSRFVILHLWLLGCYQFSIDPLFKIRGWKRPAISGPTLDSNGHLQPRPTYTDTDTDTEVGLS